MVAGANAVLSTLGVPYGRRPVTVYSHGARNILAAMDRHGVRRLVVVSSSATDPKPYADAGFFFNRVLQPFVVNVLGKTVYEDMRRMEDWSAPPASTGRSCDRRACSTPSSSPTTT